MNALAAYISNYLTVVETTINLDPPDLPEWSMDLSSNEKVASKKYMLPDMEVEGAFDGEEIEVFFYADTQYNEGFYAFVGTDTESVAELNDGSDPTFGQIGGFRIYLQGEE